MLLKLMAHLDIQLLLSVVRHHAHDLAIEEDQANVAFSRYRVAGVMSGRAASWPLYRYLRVRFPCGNRTMVFLIHVRVRDRRRATLTSDKERLIDGGQHD